MDNNAVQNRTGRWFLNVMELKDNITEEDATAGFFDKTKISNFSTDYMLRTYTAGCYYLDEKYEVWTGKGLQVINTTYDVTVCGSAHMTLFGAGFFVQPNTLDFDYIMAEADFSDNMTIYMAILVSIICYLLFLIWAKYQDIKDDKRRASKPLPDNDPSDSYVYEIIAMTGAQSQATCKSKIQFILTGEDDESDIRTFPRMTFQRSGIDSFVMATSRQVEVDFDCL